jgi:sialic acid synthase SpsE
MKKLVRDIREIPKLHGSNAKVILEAEVSIAKKLRRVHDL